MKKKILVTCLVLLSLLVLSCGKVSDNNEGDSKDSGLVEKTGKKVDEGNIITKDDVDMYGLELETPWINHALDIVYDIPVESGVSMYVGTTSHSYMHGSSFTYYGGSSMYVDMSLEGHTNLETLASDIIGEKRSDKYSFVYLFGPKFLDEFENKMTEEVTIGDIDTVYFESEDIITEAAYSSEEITIQLIGYSFKYNDKYMSVYSEYVAENKYEKEKVKERMQSLILSIRDYNGEQIQELGGNLKNYYDDGFTNDFRSEEGERKIAINYYSKHPTHGILANDYVYTILIDMPPESVIWDGTLDGILDATQTIVVEEREDGLPGYPYYYAGKKFAWVSYDRDENDEWVNNISIDILKEENVTINGIDMKHYLLESKYKDSSNGSFISVYTFIIDGQPFVFNYRIRTEVSEYIEKINGEGVAKTKEQEEVIIEQTEIVAKTFINTIRFLGDDERYLDYINIY